jgi:peptide-methionine (R)-S-oxide reductase
MTRRRELLGVAVLGGVGAFALWPRHQAARAATTFPISRTDAQWRSLLSPSAYYILREQGTEAPYSSPLDHETRQGIYHCAGCALAVYSSATKYDSHTGWPSFWRPLPHAVAEARDARLGFVRTEIHCAQCGGHLGHVFPDGPPPTGLRYCMNGAALSFTRT